MIRKLMLAKLVGFLLVGHVAAQVSSNVYELAHAIAHAEGYYTKGTIPNRAHNPGDIRALSAHQFPGQVGINSKRYAIFRNDAAGFAALYHQLEKVEAGESRFYSADITMRQFSKTYAEVNVVWLHNVCSMLRISPSMTLRQYFNSNRSLVLAADTAPLDPPTTFEFTLGDVQP